MNADDQKSSAIVTLLVKVPAKLSSVHIAKAALIEDMRGAWTEPGNYKMELYNANGQEEIFYLFERWKDLESLEFHFKQPYTQGAIELQKVDLSAPVEINYLKDLWPGVQNEVYAESYRPLTTIITSFEVIPGMEKAFTELFQEFVPLVRAQSGNYDYNFHSVIGKPQSFVLYERWEHQSDLDAHKSLQPTSAFSNRIAPLLQAPLSDCVLFATGIS